MSGGSICPTRSSKCMGPRGCSPGSPNGGGIPGNGGRMSPVEIMVVKKLKSLFTFIMISKLGCDDFIIVGVYYTNVIMLIRDYTVTQ